MRNVLIDFCAIIRVSCNKDEKIGININGGGLTDDDLMVIQGQKEKLVGVLQTRYGYAKEKTEEEYKSFLESQK